MSKMKRKDKLRCDVLTYMQKYSPSTASGVTESLRPSYKGNLSVKEVGTVLSVFEKDGVMESEPGVKPKVYRMAEVSA